ncbi:MAG: beta-aspartyl-peptidase [Bacteroidetes bacterium RIFOXYA12_FULL_35_11]|nr:MAG: beta-aspartyl-peptidase [Bacteroidetes bacterium GWF2_35_48]OFY75412.1 MAG: beta-aspartyl-peptidase [Bacteroidetes bacterium RIFOXYA12_FULL_35_11]OFY93630.1 MAG: beta-aspartyl-peptidase [Bacteroidetes bacterium RIFOXYB2_FULL_35_7]OFY97866.1 MAG: beta-aspartyl-peptidase [Bacteroidetes bacterium RIFOXYC12_FULL_35_7]HBX52566.1 beta-aspartyl-peptidase [Bacteroidales bacterium]
MRIKINSIIGFFLLLIFPSVNSFAQKWALAIHSGAGNFTPKDLTPELEKQIRKKMEEALQKGKSILTNGGSSLDAVEEVIKILEDSPLFNAGKGAVFTHEGRNELDASVMDGKTLNAGAVAGVHDVKNPICAARAVMEKSEHVFLTGKGASAFAKEQNLEIVDSSYFYTKDRWDQLQKTLEKIKEKKKGTVGCVALDKFGNLAAGTSTGGMTNKKYGRIGDSPVIGAGTYANNKTCAVSCTGHGEYFIRNVIAYDVSALIEYSGKTLQAAADFVIQDKLTKLGGTGGLIAVDNKGNISFSFNTTGMFRGFFSSDGSTKVEFFK